jgi:hypothetical protein
MIVEEGAKRGLDEKTVQGMKVVLESCSTGQGTQSFARQLSEFFPEVDAATRVMWSGNVDDTRDFQLAAIYGKLSEDENTDSSTKDFSDPGRMKAFYSTDYSYCKAHPECDTPESEQPFSKQPVLDPKTGYRRDGRDAANDHLVSSIEHEYGLSPRVAVHDALEQRAKREAYRADMAATYLDAAKSDTIETWTKALHQYPLLAIAYNYRSEMMHRASENGMTSATYTQVEQGFDGHIVQSIKNGSVRELIPNPIEMQSAELQVN